MIVEKIDLFYNSVFLNFPKGGGRMIIIIDETMGRSYSFVATREGYMAADAKIKEIVGMGHRVGGDVAKVRQYVG